MKKLLQLTRTLLVAVCLLGGANSVWGETITFDFKTATASGGITAGSLTNSSNTGGYVAGTTTAVYYPTEISSELKGYFAFQYRSTNEWSVDKGRGGLWSFAKSGNDENFSICNLQAGDIVTITLESGEIYFSSGVANATYDEAGVETTPAQWSSLVSNKPYKIKGDGKLDLQAKKYQSGTRDHMVISKVVIERPYTRSWGLDFITLATTMSPSTSKSVTKSDVAFGGSYYTITDEGFNDNLGVNNVNWQVRQSGNSVGLWPYNVNGTIAVQNLPANALIVFWASANISANSNAVKVNSLSGNNYYTFKVSSAGIATFTPTKSSYIYSMGVYEFAIGQAITDIEKYETSAEFSNYIDGQLSDGKLKTVDDVYAAHTAWQIAQAKASGSVDLTKLIRNAAVADGTDWGGSEINHGEQYTGAPDEYYLDKWNGTINTNQTIYGVPAGTYKIKAATRSAAGTSGTLYVNDGTSDIGKVKQITSVGNTGGDLGNGWSWSEMTFTLTETKNLLVGFWADASSEKWAGCDDWHMELVGEVATITPAGWASFSSSYPLDLSTISGGAAYYASAASGSTVTLTPTGNVTVPAGEGLMIKGTPNETFTIGVAASGTAISGNKLVGQTTTGEVAASTAGAYHYVFGYKTEDPSVFGFYNLTSATSVPAGKAYLETTTALNPAVAGAPILFSFDGNDETANISTTNFTNDTNKSGEVYNLNGQRVAQPTKGLYIVNGRKVVIK